MIKADNYNIGIYGIHNTTSNKWYIGSSKNIYDRIEDHKASARTRIGLFKDIPKDDNISFNILKIVKNENSLEMWENYFIGIYNSLEQGYNKMLSNRGPEITIKLSTLSEDKLCIIDDNELSDLLKLNSTDDLESLKLRIPHIKITEHIKRYNKSTVINFLLKESKINEYYYHRVIEVKDWLNDKERRKQ